MRVVVIGSGIVGAGAAYYLSERGVSVTVVDGGYHGEATQAGAGIVCPWVDHPEDEDWYRLNREGARHYPGLVEALGEDIGYAKVGALLVAEDPADLEPVRALLRRRHAEAPEMGDVVDVDTPAELFPPLSDTLRAILVPGAARVDGRTVRDALLAAAVARGARIRRAAATLTPDGRVSAHPLPGAAPAGLPQDGRHDLGVSCPAGEGEPLDADMVIVAAGAWTGEVCRPLGVELPVFPRRGQILHATLEGVDTAWWPMVLPRTGPYLLGFPDSRVVIGATVEDVGFSPRVTMGGLAEVIDAGLRVAPGLFAATVSETRVGLRPVYAPGPALIGPLTPRVVVATGLSAYGLTAGPVTGRIAAALALGEEPPIDIAPYAPPTA
ncbi:NAD(P)/FAD-dependent oxidoreductase [Nonomuraea jiangxiensis]|uniref:D-amino-acid dehydrogenase n=1 Tax=Nonomuraea jiangxiensis TaxID=633440 RepID=A0A1G8KA32_9ACTN|nr:FAD-dependent oxidoreductase [Nonomuraea jiangxiensis]SDI40227.1 D-amino-acid dehydrogenase [Nonomuraea jiangxiensis]